MKKIIILLMVFGSFEAYSQCGTSADGFSTCISGDSRNIYGLKTEEMPTFIAGNAEAISKMNGVSSIVNLNSAKYASADLKGSSMLVDGWDHSGTIIAGDKKLLLERINFDISKGEFVMKSKDDKMYTFTTENIDVFMIDNKIFKPMLNSKTGNYEVFQVMHDEDGISILKGYELVFVEASANPMLNRKANRLKKKELFFSMQQDQLRRLKISKKKLNALLEKDDHLKLKELIQNKKNRRIVGRTK